MQNRESKHREDTHGGSSKRIIPELNVPDRVREYINSLTSPNSQRPNGHSSSDGERTDHAEEAANSLKSRSSQAVKQANKLRKRKIRRSKGSLSSHDKRTYQYRRPGRPKPGVSKKFKVDFFKTMYCGKLKNVACIRQVQISRKSRTKQENPKKNVSFLKRYFF